MARIIVTTEERERSDARVTLNEQHRSDRLSDERAQLMARLGWTVVDAEPRIVGWRARYPRRGSS
jgi:hypothetical protein